MFPAKIEITGIPEIDIATAEIAVALRDAGRTEREAVAEAQRLRDAMCRGAAQLPSF